MTKSDERGEAGVSTRMSFRRRRWISTFAAALTCVGCSSTEPVSTDPAVSPHREAPAAAADHEEFLRSRTRHDLAARLGRTEQDVQVLEVRRVYWQSEALGCPEPGQRAAPGITPGYLVRLGVGGIEYRYHAGADGEPFVCPPARAEPWLDSSVD